MALFGKKKFTVVNVKKRNIPEGVWTKCPSCTQPMYAKALADNLHVCPKCDHHFPLSAHERIRLLLDENSFEEWDADLESLDPLGFRGPKTYIQKLTEDKNKTQLKDAAVSGAGRIEGLPVAFAVTDSRFIMGSMGSVVGEKISRAVERATARRWPVIIVSGSGGGARMYEGALSLMQMIKTCAALARHHRAGLLYVSVLTDPTMAGIMASFAGVGDIIIAEPKALIGFTGPRVIEQTIRQRLPEGFQRSEFLLAHGLIDMICHRRELRGCLAQILRWARQPATTANST